MVTLVLHHEGQAISLPLGDSIVGRALECRIRFNDPAVSRQHLRFIVRADRAVVQNLSNTNGTEINGVVVKEPVSLRSGDMLRIGYRTLRVELREETRESPVSLPSVVVLSHEVAPGILMDDDDAAFEATQPGTVDVRSLSAMSATQSLPVLKEHNCPQCRGRCPYEVDTCPSCGYEWPPGRPMSRTQQIKLDPVSLRAHPRFAIELPVVYSSETLGIDAVVRDLSRGGMFLATDLLDPVGTFCEITALPDGHSAVRFGGLVAHVVHEANAHGRQPGLGIRFTDVSGLARTWMEQTLAALERAQSVDDSA